MVQAASPQEETTQEHGQCPGTAQFRVGCPIVSPTPSAMQVPVSFQRSRGLTAGFKAKLKPGRWWGSSSSALGLTKPFLQPKDERGRLWEHT